MHKPQTTLIDTHALTLAERETIIKTARDAASDDLTDTSLGNVIHVCTHDVRHDAQKRREAFAIALVWGRGAHQR